MRCNKDLDDQSSHRLHVAGTYFQQTRKEVVERTTSSEDFSPEPFSLVPRSGHSSERLSTNNFSPPPVRL